MTTKTEKLAVAGRAGAGVLKTIGVALLTIAVVAGALVVGIFRAFSEAKR
jgi:hypothetical protein